jgi:hypothetical protein
VSLTWNVSATTMAQALFNSVAVLDAIPPNELNTALRLKDALDLFYEVWTRYKEHQCTDEMVNARARRIYRKAKAENLPRVPGIGQIKRTLRREEPRQFALFRDTFFMYDLSDKYRIRFPVTYEEAESRISR